MITKIKIDKKSYKNILLYNIGYVTVLSHSKINSVNSLYLIIDKTNGYIEKSNRNKYLTLVPADKSKGRMKQNHKRHIWNIMMIMMKNI